MAAPEQQEVSTAPKVTPLDESQLIGLGFRSQKDLSIVSQSEVTALLPPLCAVHATQHQPAVVREKSCTHTYTRCVPSVQVWPLMDGFIGSDPGACAMCIRNQAVAAKHAKVKRASAASSLLLLLCAFLPVDCLSHHLVAFLSPVFRF